MKTTICFCLIAAAFAVMVVTAAPVEDKPKPKVVFPKSTKALLKNISPAIPSAAQVAAAKPTTKAKLTKTSSAPKPPPAAVPVPVAIPKAVPIKSLDDLKKFFNKGDAILTTKEQ